MVSGHVSGYEFKIPIVDMSVYLEKSLFPQIHKAGGTLIQREITNLNEALDAFSCVVNCTGSGSISLCGDTSLFPIRGQTVRAEAMAEPQFIMDTDNPKNVTYIFPETEFVCDGWCGSGRRLECRTRRGDDGSDSGPLCRVSPRSRRACVEGGCRRMFVLGVSRFVWKKRFSVVPILERTLIHNYGHGGSGVTLSWGCARRGRATCDKLRQESLPFVN